MCWWLAKTDAAAKSVSAVCVTTPTVPAMRSCVRSMHAQFDRACPVGNLVSRRRKWSLQCVSSTMVSTRMRIFRLADNHRDSDASILVFKSVAATVYAFSYSTRTPPTSGDDGVRQPSLQISLERRGRKLLEQFLLVFRHFSRKNWTSAVTAQKRRGYFPITWLHLQVSITLFLCVIFSVSKTRLPTPHFIDY